MCAVAAPLVVMRRQEGMKPVATLPSLQPVSLRPSPLVE